MSDLVKLEVELADAQNMIDMLLCNAISPLEGRILLGLRRFNTCSDLVEYGVGPAPSVRRCLRRLVESGFVDIIATLPPRSADGRGRQRFVYRLVPPLGGPDADPS